MFIKPFKLKFTRVSKYTTGTLYVKVTSYLKHIQQISMFKTKGRKIQFQYIQSSKGHVPKIRMCDHILVVYVAIKGMAELLN